VSEPERKRKKGGKKKERDWGTIEAAPYNNILHSQLPITMHFHPQNGCWSLKKYDSNKEKENKHWHS